jgi:predicted MFS family arabinose efflux permease
VLDRTLLQRVVPIDRLGEFYGIRASIGFIGTPSGAAVGGALLTILSAREVIVVSGLLCISAGVVCFFPGTSQRLSNGSWMIPRGHIIQTCILEVARRTAVF